jgi:hypothetical protein
MLWQLLALEEECRRRKRQGKDPKGPLEGIFTILFVVAVLFALAPLAMNYCQPVWNWAADLWSSYFPG